MKEMTSYSEAPRDKHQKRQEPILLLNLKRQRERKLFLEPANRSSTRK